MAVSRRREYLADASAAELTRNPLALAARSRRSRRRTPRPKTIKRGSAHLCIADPMGRRIGRHEAVGRPWRRIRRWPAASQRSIRWGSRSNVARPRTSRFGEAGAAAQTSRPRASGGVDAAPRAARRVHVFLRPRSSLMADGRHATRGAAVNVARRCAAGEPVVSRTNHSWGTGICATRTARRDARRCRTRIGVLDENRPRSCRSSSC